MKTIVSFDKRERKRNVHIDLFRIHISEMLYRIRIKDDSALIKKTQKSLSLVAK